MTTDSGRSGPEPHPRFTLLQFEGLTIYTIQGLGLGRTVVIEALRLCDAVESVSRT
jgi:hypothetical protein